MLKNSIATMSSLVLRPREDQPPVAHSLFAFAAIASLLFVTQLKTLTPMLVTGLTLFFLFWRRRSLGAVLRASALCLALAVFCLLSRFWSIAPTATTYYGVQYLITVLIGCCVGAGLDRRAAFRGVFLAFAFYAVISVLFGRTVSWGGGAMGNSAFAGLAQAKNTAGDCAAVGVIFSLGMLLMALQGWQVGLAMLAGCALLLELHNLIAAHSSGAILGVALAVPMIIAWNASRLMQLSSRFMIAIISAVAAFSAMATQSIWLPPLVAGITSAMGKDSTLTGRTYLWGRADSLIAERPVLGLGYNAFWRQGNLEAEGLWRHAAIASRSGFNFHSTPTEIVVHLGYVGLVLFTLVFVAYLLMLMARTIVKPELPLIGWCGLLFYEASRMPFESIGAGPFHYTTTLLAAGLTVALSRIGEAGPKLRLRIGGSVPPWRVRSLGVT